jgi:hypothetical protein
MKIYYDYDGYDAADDIDGDGREMGVGDVASGDVAQFTPQVDRQ